MQSIKVFFGVIGSGKTHKRDICEQESTVQVKLLDFKDPLIDMCMAISKSTLPYDKFKARVIGVDSEYESHKLKNLYPGLLTGRELLQRLGTDAIRKHSPEYWVDSFDRSAASFFCLNENGLLMCADMRFPNEFKCIQNFSKVNDVLVEYIFCDYKSPVYDDTNEHPSEKFAQTFKQTYPNYEDGDIISRHALKTIAGQLT